MHKWNRGVVALLATLVAALVVAAPASAHVRVDGTDVTQGGYGVLTFRVPTESDTASTVGLTITLPDSTPIVSVSTQPKPGWSAQVVKKDLATPRKDDDGNEITQYVSQVIWKADTPQAAIAPGSFDTFAISAGPMPESESITIPAAQTYSDGQVVQWNETSSDGKSEPEHPAPVLTLASATSADEHGSSMAGMTSGDNSSGHSDSSTSPVAIAGLVVAIIALLIGIANFAIARRNDTSNR
ncbi:YcnI family protein [Gordonia jinhuaensis]|uniref:YncI copper-binding domain-containing protein n=1 Tax=Gordonia jinhuaensis TaxID=1517702 RepID=A0A916WVE4_9ACTN|nr:YcnI family protein [Gordonia jinhuaensis]GGB33090.1 hypothetical protein GCM10011489_21520 [Gordonia jinhuaensis]